MRLPTTLPIKFESNKKKGIQLPITLPIKFSNQNGIKLPTTLPFKFTSNEDVVSCKLKILTKETAQTVEVYKTKLKNRETAWNFKGLLIDETVIAKMNKSLVLMEDVRGRILLDSMLKDRTTVNVSWYGDEVPELEIYKKVSVDENYELFKTCKWEDESIDVSLDSSEYNLKVLGINSTGESSVLTVGELSAVVVNPNINISINEKVYQFDINYRSVYKIKVNL